MLSVHTRARGHPLKHGQSASGYELFRSSLSTWAVDSHRVPLGPLPSQPRASHQVYSWATQRHLVSGKKRETGWRKILFFCFYKTKIFKLIYSLRQEINGRLKGVRGNFLLDHFLKRTASFQSTWCRTNSTYLQNITSWEKKCISMKWLPRLAWVPPEEQPQIQAESSWLPPNSHATIGSVLWAQGPARTCLFVRGGLPSTFLHHQC